MPSPRPAPADSRCARLSHWMGALRGALFGASRSGRGAGCPRTLGLREALIPGTEGWHGRL